jgi:hypothetical protein
MFSPNAFKARWTEGSGMVVLRAIVEIIIAYYL